MTAEELQILERIAVAVEETNQLIRGNMAAEQELERRREKNRKRMQRNRGSDLCAHESVRAQVEVERNEEEKKEPSPYNPYKEEKEEEKKAGGTNARAKKPFVKPTIEEIAAYCKDRGFDIDAEQFWHYYESKDWVVGKAKMSKWRSAVATWVKMRKNGEIIVHKQKSTPTSPRFTERIQHADNYLPPSESLVKRMMNLSEKRDER